MQEKSNKGRLVSRILLNKWGGFEKPVICPHPYITGLFGPNGIGKSTLIDAIQIMLYGSLDNSFLNVSTDQERNQKRSVMGYLMGKMRNHPTLREDKVFSSTLAMEIHDTADDNWYCIGVCFDVKTLKNSTSDYEAQFFTMYGQLPEDRFINSDGTVYSIKDMKRLVEERKKTSPWGMSKLCVSDYTRERYRQVVSEKIFNIQGQAKLLKVLMLSSISAKFKGGLDNFIKEYLFVPDENDNLLKTVMDRFFAIKSTLCALEDLKTRRDVFEKEVEKWEVYKNSNQKLKCLEDMLKYWYVCMDNARINELNENIDAIEKDIPLLEADFDKNNNRKRELEEAKEENQKTIDLGTGLLTEKKKACQGNINLYKYENDIWSRAVTELTMWSENETVNEGFNSTQLRMIEAVNKGRISLEQYDKLINLVKERTADLKESYNEYLGIYRSLEKEHNEVLDKLNAAKKNEKHYAPVLKETCNAITEYLRILYGGKGKAYILADMFSITDNEWINAIEGIFSKKLAIITEPKYAKDAMKKLRELNRNNPAKYGGISIIDTDRLCQKEVSVRPGSLYEVVSTDTDYVDTVLKYYLGKIIQCETEEDLQNSGNGVTKDCSGYSDYTMYTIPHNHYKNPVIGKHISQKVIKALEEEERDLKEKLNEQRQNVERYDKVQNYRFRIDDPNEAVKVSCAYDKLTKEEKTLAEIEIQLNDANERLKDLHKEQERISAKIENIVSNNNEIYHKISTKKLEKESFKNQLDVSRQNLEKHKNVYVTNPEAEHRVDEMLDKRSFDNVRQNILTDTETAESELNVTKMELYKVRNEIYTHYPVLSLSPESYDERTQEDYYELYKRYDYDYNENLRKKYEEENESCQKTLCRDAIYHIRNNFDNTIRQQKAMNRLLSTVSFGSSRFRLEVGPTNTADRQFYGMMTAKELDNLTDMDSAMMGDQLTLGESQFYEVYSEQIEQFKEMILPPDELIKSEDQEYKKHLEKKWKDNVAKYLDFRTYLNFDMQEATVDEEGNEKWVSVSKLPGSSGETQNAMYVALLTGFALMYKPPKGGSTLRLMLADEAFSDMDQQRSSKVMEFAVKLGLQVILCRPSEQLNILYNSINGFVVLSADESGRVTPCHIRQKDIKTMCEENLGLSDLPDESFFGEDIEWAQNPEKKDEEKVEKKKKNSEEMEGQLSLTNLIQ